MFSLDDLTEVGRKSSTGNVKFYHLVTDINRRDKLLGTNPSF